MTSGNFFRHLWSIDCPVEGPASPSPYRCFLVEGAPEGTNVCL